MTIGPDSARQNARKILEIIPFVMRVMSSEMRHSNTQTLPAHLPLLGMLSHRPRTLTELAERQAVSLPTMSNTVTTLEERGWLTRVRSEEDRRVVLIQTTEEGRKILEETHRRAEERFATLLESLTDAEQETLSSGLSMLRRVFESAFPPRDPHCHP